MDFKFIWLFGSFYLSEANLENKYHKVITESSYFLYAFFTK